jgi:hypothetical protein
MDRGTHLDVLKAWGQDRSRTAQGFQRPSQPIRALGEAFPFIHVYPLESFIIRVHTPTAGGERCLEITY